MGSMDSLQRSAYSSNWHMHAAYTRTRTHTHTSLWNKRIWFVKQFQRSSHADKNCTSTSETMEMEWMERVLTRVTFSQDSWLLHEHDLRNVWGPLSEQPPFAWLQASTCAMPQPLFPLCLLPAPWSRLQLLSEAGRRCWACSVQRPGLTLATEWPRQYNCIPSLPCGRLSAIAGGGPQLLQS